MRTPVGQPKAHIRRGGRFSRPILIAALTAAFVAAGSPAAQAQSVSNVDPAGDMVGVEYETGESLPAPDQVRNDVIRTQMTHSATRVSVRVTYAELQRVAEFNVLYVPMVTNEGARRILTLEAGPGYWAGHTTFTRGNERPVRCAVRHSIDYAQNVAVVSFPRRCASSPRWVKFRVAAATFEDDGVFYADDALRDGPMLEDSLAQSRRVYRAS